MLGLRLLSSLLLVSWVTGSSKFWGLLALRGGASQYPQSLLDDVDDFDYIREREEILAREALAAGTLSDEPQRNHHPAAPKNTSAPQVEQEDLDQGYAEDDRTDDEEVFFKGRRRNRDD